MTSNAQVKGQECDKNCEAQCASKEQVCTSITSNAQVKNKYAAQVHLKTASKQSLVKKHAYDILLT